jgi:hypothetical protein
MFMGYIYIYSITQEEKISSLPTSTKTTSSPFQMEKNHFTVHIRFHNM